jgi:lysophospholipase L1-like esterase
MRTPSRACAIVLAFLALIGGAWLSSAATAAAPAPVRVMPLGDSITGSPGCWRALLWNRLQNAGLTNVDFVGTLPAQGCSVPYDGDNEGHGGFLATNVAAQNQLPGWLSATHPDVVLMHFGTNDVWNNIAPATILSAFSTLVAQMRADNPAMKVLVAQIIPMNPSGCPDCAQRVVAFNAAIPAWASGISTAQSPVTVVDQWTGFNDATDTGDGVHPNDSGNQKMSDRWYPALAPLIAGATTSPSASPTRSPSASPSPSPSASVPAGGCTASYQVVGQWPGGFQGQVTLTNTGTGTMTGWAVTATFPGSQTVTQAWNATETQAGTIATFHSATWNASVPPGGTVTVGFLGSGAASPPPVVRC